MRIDSNGSKWAGEAPDSVDVLLAVLNDPAQVLDPRFERYGNFVYKIDAKAAAKEEVGITHRAFGNFRTISHGFCISGSKAELEPLRRAIRAHQRRPAYQAMRGEG